MLGTREGLQVINIHSITFQTILKGVYSTQVSTLSFKMKVFIFLILLKVISAQNPGSTFDFANPRGVSYNFGSPAAENECKTDEETCRCCTNMQKVENMKKTLNQKLDILLNNYNKAQDVYNELTAKRSAFSAALFLNHANLMCLGPFTDTRTIVYKNVFFNMGNNYNVTTGIYTAPHAGVYSLSVSVFHDAGQESNEQSCVNMMVNNNMIAGSSDSHRYDHEDSTTVSIAKHLNAGDKVEVKLKSGCLLCMENSHYNVFSAYLLYAD